MPGASPPLVKIATTLSECGASSTSAVADQFTVAEPLGVDAAQTAVSEQSFTYQP